MGRGRSWPRRSASPAEEVSFMSTSRFTLSRFGCALAFLVAFASDSARAEWVGGLFPVAGVDDTVNAFVTFDDGPGAALYAGGRFAFAGVHAASRVARWDGVEWTPVGGGVDGEVLALAVFDDGSGPALYAGGLFTSAAGASASRVAR